MGHHRSQEIVGAAERLGFALEIHLLILVERFGIDRHASIENWIQRVPFRAGEEQFDDLLHLFE